MSLSAVVVQPPSAIFREEQRFGWWAYAILAVIVSLTWAALNGRGPAAAGFVSRHAPLSVAMGFGLPMMLVVFVLRMTTLVTPTDVRVWFGFVPSYRRAISLAGISKVEVVQYRPIVHSMGWGVRIARDGERILNARGDRGVRLHLVDGSKVLLGSQRPEELALALDGALRRGL